MNRVTNDELKQLIERLYDEVLRGANHILQNCKAFPMSILQLKDPSYSEMAAQLRKLCGFMEFLINPDLDEVEYAVTKAKEYTDFAHDVAKAIEAGDQIRLNELISILDKRSFS